MSQRAPRVALYSLLLLALAGCCCPRASSPCVADAPSEVVVPTKDARQIFIDVMTVRIPHSQMEQVLGDLRPGSGSKPTPLSAEQAKQLATAFEKSSGVQVLQAPKLLALEGQESTIFIGETIHFARTKATKKRGGLDLKITQDAKSPVWIGYQLKVTAIPNDEGSRIALDLEELTRQALKPKSKEETARMGAEAFLRELVIEQRIDASFESENDGQVLIGGPGVYEDEEGRFVRVSIVHVKLLAQDEAEKTTAG